MIVGERIVKISGTKEKWEPIKGLNINISLEDIKVDGENVEMHYAYTANYEEGIGSLTIKGILMAKEDKKTAKKIEDEWKKNKKIPDDYAQSTLSAINYSGSANGTLLARVIGLTAPLIPPRIAVKGKE
ncbi:TPA: hypothetical protein EYP38_02755 [Candidatus Micrarchaeota archaeon]|nr:hypothetical protein [Candidatus Micrarchaeota archaeon]